MAIFQDPNYLLALAGAIVALASLIVACYPIWESRRRKRLLVKRLSRGSFTEEVIGNSTRYFIRSKCTNLDPAQEKELRHALAVARDDLFQVVDRFIQGEGATKHMMVLADSGTGKTTFVLNYYVYNQRKRRGKRHPLAIVPLGHEDADGLIRQILALDSPYDPGKTVLFLDALDEDTQAVADHFQRIRALMELCRPFRRVVLTCRTQFFRKDEEIPLDTGIVRVGPREAGQKGTIEFRKLYLAPFDDDDVRRYLRKRYHFWWLQFWSGSPYRRSLAMARQIELLSVRPMLLAHIPVIAGKGRFTTHITELYEIMVDAWVKREEGWIAPHTLTEFSERLAIDIFYKRKARGSERVPGDDVCRFARRWCRGEPEWKFTGRSLLNRDAEGHFKFAHRSIMEYLFVRRFVRLPLEERVAVEWTDQMRAFLNDLLLRKPDITDLRRADLRNWIITNDMRIDEANLMGSRLRVSDLDMEFVYTPPGTFLMGSPEDEPGRLDREKQHEVTLSQGFFLQTTPVTQGQYKTIMGKNPSNFKKIGPDGPVENVSWKDAQEFIQKLSERDGTLSYRLPTEAEWEHACRAGTTTPFWWGRCLSTDEANYDGNHPLEGCPKGKYRKATTPVKMFPPNSWGLHDMHGNVWEWCQDWFGDYPDGPVTDPTGPETGEYRVVRGGSWLSSARNCRSAHRSWRVPEGRNDYLGFRLVRLPGR